MYPPGMRILMPQSAAKLWMYCSACFYSAGRPGMSRGCVWLAGVARKVWSRLPEAVA